MANNLNNQPWGNTEPYFDDYNESKGFYKILYRPGYAVQARELTQMQSIINNQIARFGSSIFKEGSMVIPGASSLDTTISYVTVKDVAGSAPADSILENLVGLTVTDGNGISAEVVYYAKSTATDPSTLFVKYNSSSSSDATVGKFLVNSNISDTNDLYTVEVLSTGTGSIASIQEGVYFIKNNFVYVPSQTIVLDKYSSTPSYRIGLISTEKIVTPEDDSSLYDNAQNSFNYNAPGAHRYYIDAVLTAISLDSTDDKDFIELIRVSSGSILFKVEHTTYSELEKELARRTYDESGNYTVSNFEIDVREYRNNDRGQWTANTYYLLGDVVSNAGNTYTAKNSGFSATSTSATAPSHLSGEVYDGGGSSGIQWEYTPTPAYNRGINQITTNTQQAHLDAEAKLAIGLEPGSAYVEGYEIKKIATEYVSVNKARDTAIANEKIIRAEVGNYVLVTNINGVPPINTGAQVTLYNRFSSYTPGSGVSDPSGSGATAVGTARVRLIEWFNGTVGTQSVVYKLALFDVQMNNDYDFSRNVKSIYWNSGNTHTSFYSDISANLVDLSGGALYSYTDGTYTTAGSGTHIQGSGTTFITSLVVGDYVKFSDGTVSRVTAVDSQTRIQVSSSINISNVNVSLIKTEILEPENSSLVFPIPNTAIKTVDKTNTSYSVYKKYIGTVSSATLSIAPLAGETFFSTNNASQDYIIINNDSASGGQVIPASDITGISLDGNNLKITFSSPAYNNKQVAVIASIHKDGSTGLRYKTLARISTTITDSGQATASIINLGNADGYRLVSVMMDTGTFVSPTGVYTVDITDRYTFDGGQRDSYYDNASISLNATFAAPTAPITVVFEYFTHSSGDYFTVDSYPNTIDYTDIPVYNGYSMSDVVDFRSEVSNPSLVPKRGEDITADYTYYLARNTKIVLNSQGVFYGIDGASSITPVDAPDPAKGMVVYNLSLSPYTYSADSTSVKIGRVDNKRYTMRDIGRLETRISNLEYYTALSLLEQQTESLNVSDSFGNSRFKNGFIVDSFQGQGVGDSSNPDYLCSIDMNNAELRPFYSMKNVNLVEKVPTGGRSGYIVYGDVITLPKTEDVSLISQTYGTRVENINPFAVATFLGDINITPSSDDWFETNTLPDIVNNIDGNFDALLNISEQAGVLGTVWNA